MVSIKINNTYTHYSHEIKLSLYRHTNWYELCRTKFWSLLVSSLKMFKIISCVCVIVCNPKVYISIFLDKNFVVLLNLNLTKPNKLHTLRIYLKIFRIFKSLNIYLFLQTSCKKKITVTHLNILDLMLNINIHENNCLKNVRIYITIYSIPIRLKHNA